MSKLSDYTLLSFDVYGTLIDWETGILTALAPLLANTPTPRPTPASLLTLYHRLELAQQFLTPTLPYSALLTTLYPQLASALSLPPPTPAASAAFGASIGSWPAFPDTVSALRRLSEHCKLAILSNTDPAAFAATNAGPLQGIPFDLVLTAHDIGSYKPDPRNFKALISEVQSQLGVSKEKLLHVAQSQVHDCVPARGAGWRCVWIDRAGGIMGRGEGEGVWDWRFETLAELADAVEREKEE